MYLYKVLIGCKPKGRHTEQHDVYIGISDCMANMIPQLKKFWPEAASSMHIDGFKKITTVDNYSIKIVEKSSAEISTHQLFFINLGGYKPNELEEYHYKMIVAGIDKAAAIKAAKQTAFYKHTGFKGAESHIDDKYGIDVDDIYAIEDMLPNYLKKQFKIIVSATENTIADDLHLGYFPLRKIEKMLEI
jgi:Domain of Unknown Function (DUF1543)